MKIYTCLMFLLVLEGCAGIRIYRDCKQVGTDSNGKALYDSCEVLK